MVMMKKRVVLLRSNPIAPDPPVEKVADTLLSQGYEVTAVGWDRGSDTGERTETLKLEHGEARAVRFGIPALFNAGFKKNLIPLARFEMKLYNWLKQHRNEYDIIHSFDFDTGFAADKIAAKYNKALIYHILDFYIDSHNVPGTSLRAKVKNAEISVINDAFATIICTDKRREQIAESSPKRLEVIHNTPKAFEKIDNSFEAVAADGKFKIVYVGILGSSRFLREIMRFVESDERFEFHIGGFGSMEPEIEEAAKKCSRIIYYGKLPYEKTLALEKACDIMTAIYDPSVPNHRYAAPNKFYESLMLGKPVVMARNTGFDEIIEKNNIGCLIEYSEKGLAEGLNALVDRREEWDAMGERMKRLYNEQYSWAEMEKRIIDLYSEI